MTDEARGKGTGKRRGFQSVTVEREEVDGAGSSTSVDFDEPYAPKKEKKKEKTKAKKGPAPNPVTPEGDDDDDGGLSRLLQRAAEIVAPDFEQNYVVNGQLEFFTLVHCVLDESLRGRLWPRLSEDHFASPTNKALFDRLSMLTRSGRDWPRLAILTADQTLPTATRAQIATIIARVDRGSPIHHKTIQIADVEVPLETAEDFEGYVFDVLDALRITRSSMSLMVEAVTEVSKEEFDPFSGPAHFEAAAANVLSVRGREDIADAMLQFGHGTTEEDDRKRKTELDNMFNQNTVQYPTGFLDFDRKAGGFKAGEVVLMGANSGGGKTAMMLSVMTQMAKAGVSTAMLQLELTLAQVNERLSGNLAGVDTSNLRRGVTTHIAKQRIVDAWDKYHAALKKVAARHTIYAPSSATIQSAEMIFKQHEYKVWFIDYVNLLKEASGSEGDGWMKLADIVKKFKEIAKKYKIAIVLAVQINVDADTGEISIRYAKAMQEHADNVWVWQLTKEARKDGVVWIQQLKARQFEPFDFSVGVQLHHGRFVSLTKSTDVDPGKDSRPLAGANQIKVKDPKKDKPDVFKKREKAAISADVVSAVFGDIDDD